MDFSSEPVSSRARAIHPFYAVEVYRRALALGKTGRTTLMCIGEPDFPTPERVVRAASAAALAGETHYTMPLGIPPLRKAIAAHYGERYAVPVDAERVVVTVGASGALLLAFASIADAGDEILMSDPCYPSNRACLAFCGAGAGLIPVGEAECFQLTADLVRRHWGPRTKGVMVASPSNPSGTSIAWDELRAIYEVVKERRGTLIVDEIYHGLTYGHRPPSAASLGPDVYVVNSFSKYYCMTGWRLGWLVAPATAVPALERMQAHFFICPPGPSQYAGLAALEPESVAIFEQQRLELEQRRDYLVGALNTGGLRVPCPPDGAFYCYVDVSSFTRDSWTFAMDLLEATGVAVTPGRDFGINRANEFVRISFTSPREALAAGVESITQFIRTR